MRNLPSHILISRTDNIGDVILTLGMAAIIKQQAPHTRITLLARDYVRAVAALSPVVDDFFPVDGWHELPIRTAMQQLRALQADCLIHAFPNARIAWLGRLAGIPQCIGTSRRWYHRLTCTHRPNFSRANSMRHEAELNLELLRPFGIEPPADADAMIPLLRLNTPARSPELPLASNKFNLVVHPFSNGNTREWPLSYFDQLIAGLPADRFQVILTGSSTEHARLQPLQRAHPHVIDTSGTLSLGQLAALIAHADGLIANSTGPLHLAAALGIRTLGLFPLAHNPGPQRWRPLGIRAEYLTAPTAQCPPTPCDQTNCACIRAIPASATLMRILAWERAHDE